MLRRFTILLPLTVVVLATPVTKRDYALDIFAQRDGQCFIPAARAITDGTPVISGSCDTVYSWDISYGSGAVVLSGTNFCLDAGSNPGNNGALKLWTCYPGLFQQNWYYTNDRRIAITGGNQCLDEGTNGIQTYQCTPGNNNQIFFATSNRGFTLQPPGASSTAPPPPPPSASSSSTTPPPPTTTGVLPNVPFGVVQPYPPAGQGRQLHPFGRPDLCLTVQNGYAAQGSSVALSYCFGLTDTWIGLQLWDTPPANTVGQVHLHGTVYCLDFGSVPANGVAAKIWNCIPDYAAVAVKNPAIGQQNFDYTTDNIGLANNVFCLDVKLGSSPGSQKPYNSVGDVQSWQCDYNNRQQAWPKTI